MVEVTSEEMRISDIEHEEFDQLKARNRELRSLSREAALAIQKQGA